MKGTNMYQGEKRENCSATQTQRELKSASEALKNGTKTGTEQMRDAGDQLEKTLSFRGKGPQGQKKGPALKQGKGRREQRCQVRKHCSQRQEWALWK